MVAHAFIALIAVIAVAHAPVLVEAYVRNNALTDAAYQAARALTRQFFPLGASNRCPNLPPSQGLFRLNYDDNNNMDWFRHLNSTQVVAPGVIVAVTPVPAPKNIAAQAQQQSYKNLFEQQQKWMNMWSNAMTGGLSKLNSGGGGSGGFQLPNFGGLIGGGGSCPSLPAQRITPHFKQWLDANGYKQYEFETNGCGRGNSFGGQQNDADKPSGGSKRPVVFIHGNSDSAIGTGNMAGMMKMCGWAPNIKHFMDKAGYKMADLYALTWGPNDAMKAVQQTHNNVYLERINRFIQAVLDYTKADKVDVIGHSMGVTLGRGAIAGLNGAGPKLSRRVANFIGIAGGNRGLSACITPFIATCNADTGFDRNSKFLNALNTGENAKVADNIYSIWSPSDSLVKCETVSPNTCIVAGQKCDVKVPGLDHIPVRDQTSQQQLQLLTSGRC